MVEVDDFSDESAEVCGCQGPRFPYNRGLWLMSQLVGAINPFDLDALDDEQPFSRHTLDELFGRKHTTQEYEAYWNNHPSAQSKYNNHYHEFLTEKKHGKQIVDPRGTDAIITALPRLVLRG